MFRRWVLKIMMLICMGILLIGCGKKGQPVPARQFLSLTAEVIPAKVGIQR